MFGEIWNIWRPYSVIKNSIVIGVAIISKWKYCELKFKKLNQQVRIAFGNIGSEKVFHKSESEPDMFGQIRTNPISIGFESDAQL